MWKFSARFGEAFPVGAWMRFGSSTRNVQRLGSATTKLLSELGTRLRAVADVTARHWGLYAVDLTMSGLALAAAATFRLGLENPTLHQQFVAVVFALPVFVAICALVFPLVGLYDRNWRYTSIPDLVPIAKAVCLGSLIFISSMFLFTRLESVPRSVIALEIPLLILLLTAVRVSFRLDELWTCFSVRSSAKWKTEKSVPILLVGAGNAADHYLRALPRDATSTYWPVGILDRSRNQRGMLLRGVPVLGGLEDFETVMRYLEARDRRPRHLIFTETFSSFGEQSAGQLFEKAEKNGIAVSRLPSPTELRNPTSENRMELRPIELTDLLERPQAALDREALRRLISQRRVLVTGSGGSIGSELTQQIAALDPSELILVENNEYNLYSIDLELRERFPSISRFPYLCNIREIARVNEIFDQHRPQIIFHAAALKHVPIVEQNPCEGVLTNVVGTMHVAEAARRTGAMAMVMISSDKVVNSTSVMGMTKRLAELYCQALDIDCMKGPDGPRFMTVRFGNVLGSSGSLIPLFKRQLARGGPLTVTDPEMRRFFMTVREAVELTLQASAIGLEQKLGQGEIFVLDMGEPIKIIDIARRMIRLAGYSPDKDVEIKIVGRRPGEKLYEELFDATEQRVQSPIPGVLGAVPTAIPLIALREQFIRMHQSAKVGDAANILARVVEVLPGYHPESGTFTSPEPRSEAA